ncbi:MAG TPA: DUF1361 domain-containing protein [Candidatus Saccharimonadales bacterium]|nr:DUF1361 domain-containing protein [Candidatus Saccharimonadales bacterium]
MEKWRSPRGQYVMALAVASFVSMGLFVYGAWRSQDFTASYLPWNLVLAWLPLMLAVWLMDILRRKAWSSWEGIAASFLWMAFLPNSFYLISDFIHLQEVDPAYVLYDAVMFTSFVFTGLALGFTSLYLVHGALKQRLDGRRSAIWTGMVLLFCSIAIYMGRDLRWNTWDIFVNPAGLLFEAADRLQHPASYPHMLLVITIFFVLLTTIYNLLWRAARLLSEGAKPR